MFGLLIRVQLLCSLGLFFLQLTRELLYPIRSTILILILTMWFATAAGLGVVSSVKSVSSQPQSYLLTLLHEDLFLAGFSVNAVQPTQLRAQQQVWESQFKHLPASRDLLINGALLHFALGERAKANFLYESAQHSDPNHPLFSLQLPQFFK